MTVLKSCSINSIQPSMQPQSSPFPPRTDMPKPVSKKGLRLETLPQQHVPSALLASPPLPRKNETVLLKKSQNSQSSYLRRVKMGSVRVRNETNLAQHPSNIADPWTSPQTVFHQKDQNQQQSSQQTKGRSARSFMIRKKNNSLHSKRAQDTSTKVLQNDAESSRVKDFPGYSKQVCLKISQEEKVCPLQKQQKKTDQHCEIKQHSAYSNFSKEEGEQKVKTVMCREPKKISRIVSNQSQNSYEHVPTVEHHTIDPSTEVLRKVKAGREATNQSQKKERPQTREGSRHHKHRTYTGCKTIRMPWQTHNGNYYQQLQHMQTKKSKQKFVPVANELRVEEEMFGGISMIPEQEGLYSKKNSVVVESLQELVLELPNDGIFSSEELKTQDLIQ